MFIEESKNKNGIVNYSVVKQKWMEWFKNYAGRTNP
jgi:hypothetical protein